MKVAGLMCEHDTGSVLILDHDMLVGIITDRDIVKGLVSAGYPGCDWPVSRFMTPRPLTCFDDQPVEEALAIMADNQVRRLPVLNHESHLVGMLSVDMIAEHFSEHLAGQILGEIVERRSRRGRTH
jgi:CBS domain-containing protein